MCESVLKHTYNHNVHVDIYYIYTSFFCVSRESGDHISDLLEKQADLIRYLKDRNTRLSHKIMLLSRQLKGEQT
jgi:hypothetical protein